MVERLRTSEAGCEKLYLSLRLNIESDQHTEIVTASAEESLPRSFFWGVVRLLSWLVAASYIEDTPHPIQAILLIAWFAAFFWRYVFRRSADVIQSARIRRARAELGTGFRLTLIPAAVALCAAVAISVPWWVSLFTAACGHPRYFGVLWRNHLDEGGVGLSSALAACLFVLRTATYPLVEEFTFRGWLLAPLRRRFGKHLAIIATAILFAFFHLSPYFLVRNFLLGVVSGYVVVLTGSIWTSVAMHFTFNMVSSLVPATPLYDLLRRAFMTPLFNCQSSVIALIVFVAAVLGIAIGLGRPRSQPVHEDAPQ
jgi:membrane protease YdiL (CAAX protease family)